MVEIRSLLTSGSGEMQTKQDAVDELAVSSNYQRILDYSLNLPG